MAKPKIMSDIGNTENLVTEQKELVSAINSVVEAVNGKIDKTQIKNSLTETEIGNTLDATQGKVLNDRLGLLESDCLKLGHVKVGLDLKTLTKQDVGEFYLENGINTPEGASNYGYVKVSEPNIDSHLKITYAPWDTGKDYILIKKVGYGNLGLKWLQQNHLLSQFQTIQTCRFIYQQ